MEPIAGGIKGRGASHNIPNRFETLSYVRDADSNEADDNRPPTQFLKDSSKSIIARNDSPDVGFNASVNPYRGCEHGCIYCYARPTHEYLGFSSGLDFETRILVKEDAPQLLRQELSSPKWTPQIVALSGVTDPYQPIERKLQITRRCLEVFAEFRNPVIIVTKNHLVTRDIDILKELARYNAVGVCVSVTSLDPELTRVMEPRTSIPSRRLDAIRELSEAGVPAGVMVAPVVPAINDHEIPSILTETARAGARFAGYVVMRLPYGVKDLFEKWLEEHFPNRKKKVLNRILDIRGGKLNDPRFKSRMKGEGVFAMQIEALFALAARRAGFTERRAQLSTEHFRRPGSAQLTLFDL